MLELSKFSLETKDITITLEYVKISDEVDKYYVVENYEQKNRKDEFSFYELDNAKIYFEHSIKIALKEL